MTAIPPKGWFWVENGVIDQLGSIGTMAFAVYGVLARHADQRRECYPSLKTISNALGASKRSVLRAIGTLEKVGLLKVQRSSNQKGAGGNTSNRYMLPPLAPSDSTAPGVSRDTAPGDTRAPGPVTAEHPEQDTVNKTQEDKTKRSTAGEDTFPAELLTLIDGWNSLGESIVKPGNGARRDPPAKVVLRGWDRAQKNPDQRQALQDLPRLFQEIRKATFLHGQGWFTLPWLFGTNKNQELNICRLLSGAYNEIGGAKNGNRIKPPRPGQRHPDDIHSVVGEF